MRFTPTITDADIRKEAVRMLTKAAEARARAEYEEALLREKENKEQAQVCKRTKSLIIMVVLYLFTH